MGGKAKVKSKKKSKAYDLKFDADDIGLRLGKDTSDRSIRELEPDELMVYGQALKKHLWSGHGFSTSRMTDLYPFSATELEQVHYVLHEMGWLKQRHVHESLTYPRVDSLPEDGETGAEQRVRKEIDKMRSGRG